MKLLAIDLYAGMGGWARGFLAEGYECVGFDIERWPYPGQLVLQDVRTLCGWQFRDATIIVASPPCNEFSYRAMPWKIAKAQRPAVLPRWWDKAETEMSPEELKEWECWKREHPLPPPDTSLFEACFRIQREASEAAGRHIPLVVENVRGAQKWVGRSKWNFGSYHLWADVPALMPITFAGYKSRGMNWSDRTKHGQDFTRLAARHCADEGQKGQCGSWFGDYKKRGLRGGNIELLSMTPSHSARRKAASAKIAMIPFPLARHIAAVYKNGHHS